MRNACGGPWPRRSDPEEAIAKVQAAAEEMTMNRYVHTIPLAADQDQEGEELWCQLEELNRVMDYQNKILVEILAALDRLAGAVEGRAEH